MSKEDVLDLTYQYGSTSYKATYVCVNNEAYYWRLGEDISGAMLERIKKHYKTQLDEFRNR